MFKCLSRVSPEVSGKYRPALNYALDFRKLSLIFVPAMNTRKLLAANWKMNLTLTEAEELARGILSYVTREKIQERIVLAPAFPFLVSVRNIVGENLLVAAQNVSEHSRGAFTGEVSAEMLASAGCSYAIIGHSERRKYFNEDEKLFIQKIKRLQEHSLKPIYCVGETPEEREAQQSEEVVKKQLTPLFEEFSAEEFSDFVIAYEPVWAIGTGKAATPEQANAMHKFIRKLVAEKYGDSLAENLTVLYGGSVKPANAEALFSQSDIDGGLVGGASLKADSFNELIRILFS